MLLTQTVLLKLNKPEKEILVNLCHLCKNLFNVGLYTVRQYFFQEQKYLSYESNYHLCKKNENYQLLATDCGQQTLKYVDRCFKVFFKLLLMRREGTYQEKVSLPRYLPKDGHFPLLSYRRKNQVNDYLNKAARYIVNFCLDRKIGTIIVGYNPTLKQETNSIRHS